MNELICVKIGNLPAYAILVTAVFALFVFVTAKLMIYTQRKKRGEKNK